MYAWAHDIEITPIDSSQLLILESKLKNQQMNLNSSAVLALTFVSDSSIEPLTCRVAAQH